MCFKQSPFFPALSTSKNPTWPQWAPSSRPDGSATFKCHGTQSFGSDLTRAVWTTGGVAGGLGGIFGRENQRGEAIFKQFLLKVTSILLALYFLVVVSVFCGLVWLKHTPPFWFQCEAEVNLAPPTPAHGNRTVLEIGRWGGSTGWIVFLLGPNESPFPTKGQPVLWTWNSPQIWDWWWTCTQKGL